MNYFLLAGTAAENGVSNVDLILEYVIYAAIIVVGLFVLALLRRAGRLPKHGELKKQLAAFIEELETFRRSAASLTRYQFFRRVSKLLYRADKLEFITAQMSDKERDGDIGSASLLIQNARDLISPYKYSKRDSADLAGFTEAIEKVKDAAQIIDNIIARDSELKARRSKKNES